MWKYYKRWVKTAAKHSIGTSDLWGGLASSAVVIVNHLLPATQQFSTELLWQIPLWAFAGVIIIRLALAPHWIAIEESKKHGEMAAELAAIKQSYDELIEAQKPRIEFLGLLYDNTDPANPWFLQIHNKSKAAPVPNCKAYLEKMETIEGESYLPSNLILGTRNQFREKREQGPFELAPDQTKEILICDAIVGNATFPFRMKWAQGGEMKLKMGHYRLHILAFGPPGEPLRTTVVIKGDKVYLEAK